MSSLKELFLLAGVIVYQLESDSCFCVFIIIAVVWTMLVLYSLNDVQDYICIFTICSVLWIFSHFCFSLTKIFKFSQFNVIFIHFSLFYSKGNKRLINFDNNNAKLNQIINALYINLNQQTQVKLVVKRQ